MTPPNGSTQPNDTRRRGWVHPRWVWVGTVLAVAGLVLVSAGLMTHSLVLDAVGLVVVTAGAGLAWRAGVLRDTHTGSAVREVTDVRRGRVHRGTDAGDMVHNRAAQEESRAADQRRHEFLERSRRTQVGALAHGAAVIMLVICLVLLYAQWALYPTGRTAQNNALRALGVAVVVSLCGLRILTAHQPKRPAAVLAGLAGAVLALFGPLAPHQQTSVAWTETALGTLIVLAALAALASPPDATDGQLTGRSHSPPGQESTTEPDAVP
jgi:hypothetical protein